MNDTRILGADGYAHPLEQRSPLADVDIGDARARIGPFSVPAAIARLRLKEWQHYCLLSPTHLVTLAIVDVKFLKLAWVQVVDLATGARFEHHRQRVVADTHLARSLWDERSWFETRGFRLAFHSNLRDGGHGIEIDIARSGDLPAVRAAWRCHHDLAKIEPLVVSMPVSADRCAYTHKVPVPCDGSLEIDGVAHAWTTSDCVAILDIHKAHYPRHTFWRWATFAGRDSQGRAVGFNLTKNVVRDDEHHNENAVWVDGRISRFGPAVFDMDIDRKLAPWRLRTTDDRVSLTFSPVGARTEDTDVPGIARSRFQQLYGRFSGQLQGDDGLVEIDGLWGLCEDHDSIW